MRILVVSSGALPSPSPSYAGLENIAAWFSITAAKAGHKVTLISAKGSPWARATVDVNLEVLETVYPTWEGEATHFQQYKDLILQEYAGEKNAEDSIVFDHTWLCYAYLVPIKTGKSCNIVHTHHGILGFRNPPPVPYPCFVGISKAHSLHLENTLGIPARVVHNGIPLQDTAISTQDDGFLLSLNRISKEKGIIESLDVGLETRTPIKIAGDDTHIVDQRYANSVWRRCKDNSHLAEYMGLVDNSTKIDLLKRCKALIALPQATWIEAFGLSAVEANSYGKPVIAAKNGGLMDIVVNGENGYLVSGAAQAKDLIRMRALEKIKPETCRWHAERFSIENMTRRYLELFEGILERNERW